MADGQGIRCTVTALFTDIEGSTRLWDEHPGVAADLIDHHDRLLAEAFADAGGTLVAHTGDGLLARFARPIDAVRAAIRAQRHLRDTDWGTVGAIRVRMGVHTGEAVDRPDGLVGWALNFCSRLTDIGHGGQVLVSEATVEQLDSDELGDIGIVDLGRFGLRDVPGATQVFQLAVDDLPSEFPPPRKTISTTRPVPQLRSPLFGRDGDLEELVQRLEGNALVTVTGPPGVGKTRLCIELAHRLTSTIGGPELLWCDLAGIPSEDVAASIMTTHAIAVRPGRAAAESLVDWLSERRAVVVLDRCDECLSSVGRLVASIAEQAASVTVVATSQHVLATPDEVVIRLGPLDVEAAADMFVDRTLAGGGRDVDRHLAADVCRLVDRLPFAIELAAAHSVTFSAIEVRDALVANGFAAVGADDRARTIDDAVGLAIDALEPVVRDRLMASSVFAGAFDSVAFRAVCEPNEPEGLSRTLVELVDASLLQPVSDTEGTMFRLLDPVRNVVHRRTDASAIEAAASRLRSYTLELSAEVSAGLRGPSEAVWLRTFDRQFDVMRGVFHRAVEQDDLAAAVRLATDQWEWAFFRFNSEYFDWGRVVVERFGHRPEPSLGPVHGVVALGHWFRDEFARTTHHANEALRLERELGAPFSLPARMALINAAVFAGAAAPPPGVFAESDAYHRNSPEGFYRMNAEAQNAIMAVWLGRFDVAEVSAIGALRIARECGNPTSIAYALWALGQAIEHDDVAWAEHLFDEALQQARDLDNRWIITLVQLSLASSRRRSAGPLAAAGLLDDLLTQLMRAGHWAQVWNVVRLVALVAADVDNDELAYQLAAAVAAAELTFPAFPADARAFEEMQERIAARRGETWTRRARSLGTTWRPTDAARAARAGLAAVIGR